MSRLFRIAPVIAILAVLVALSGCAAIPITSDEDLDAAYRAAVADARVPTPEKISKRLVPLVRWNDGLRFDDAGRVLMATFTKAKFYADRSTYHAGAAFPLYGESWFTAVPGLKSFCAHTGLAGDALRLRIAQRLGLPPDSANDSILQVWVRPRDLFRPCPDPAVTDSQCQVRVPNARLGVDGVCDIDTEQVSQSFVQVSASHLQWMCEWRKQAYGDGTQYPWTALGYTYDWGPGDSRVGESEFVASGGVNVAFESITPIAAYCAR